MEPEDIIRIYRELDEITVKPSRFSTHLGAAVFGLAASLPLWILLFHDWLKGWVK